MTKIVLEGLMQVDTEDAGMALIGNGFEQVPNSPNGFFVRLQSWDDTKRHSTFRTLEGKRLRVTIEVID